MLDGPLRLTNSEMTTFRECKRKWWLGYYRGLSLRGTRTPGNPLSIGTFVHDALAEYYGEGKDPVAWAESQLQGRLDAMPQHAKDVQKEYELVHAMLTGYLEWLGETGADSDLRIVGAEQAVEVALSPEVKLLSKLDAPVELISSGQRLALEHKTVGDLSTPLYLLRIDSQLLTEHLARFLHQLSEGATPEEAISDCSGVLYNMLRKVKRTAAAKPPFYRREVVPHNIDELRNHWKHVMRYAQEILQAHRDLDAGVSHHSVVPPSPGKDCKWKCDFFRICPMFNDGSRVEDAIENIYEVRDPLERYDNTERM